MRRLRIAAPAQLNLGIDTYLLSPAERWSLLSEEARTAVVAVLSRMIAAGVVEECEEVDDEAGEQ